MSAVSIPLPDVVIANSARATLAQLTSMLAKHDGATVYLDASALKHFDSSALAVLLECSRLARGAGKACLITQAPAKLTALVALYGLDELLPSVATTS